MSGSIVDLIIQLLAGAAGGNVVGSLLKQYSLGPLGNSIAGIIGGGLGGQLLGMVLGAGATGSSGGLDIGSLITQIAGGRVGGGVLMVLAGMIREALGRQRARS